MLPCGRQARRGYLSDLRTSVTETGDVGDASGYTIFWSEAYWTVMVGGVRALVVMDNLGARGVSR